MAIAFVNGNQGNTATPPTVTVNKPTNTADNDILLACGYFFDGTTPPTLTLPDGWTQITTNALSSTTRLAWWAWKRASGEGASYAFSTTATATLLTAIVLSYSGCITTGTPYDQLSNTAYTTSDNYIVGASITPTVSPSMGIILGAARAVYTSGTVDGSFTERWDFAGGGFIYAAEKALSNTSATNNVTITAAGTATGAKHAILLNLKEPAAASFTGLTVKHYITG